MQHFNDPEPPAELSRGDGLPERNPYAPTLATSPQSPDLNRPPGETPYQRATLTKTAIRWLLVCGLSAIPSFFFGLGITGGQVMGMILGILTFAAGYTLLDYRTAARPFRQSRITRRTLKIAYGTRIAISIIFPVGAYLDLICGLASISITQALVDTDFGPGRGGGQMSFFATYVTTLIQGCTLNVVLGVYALIVHGIQHFVSFVRQ